MQINAQRKLPDLPVSRWTTMLARATDCDLILQYLEFAAQNNNIFYQQQKISDADCRPIWLCSCVRYH